MNILESMSNFKMCLSWYVKCWLCPYPIKGCYSFWLFRKARALTRNAWLNQPPLNKFKRKNLNIQEFIQLSFLHSLFLVIIYECDMHSSNGYFYILGNKILKFFSKQMTWKARWYAVDLLMDFAVWLRILEFLLMTKRLFVLRHFIFLLVWNRLSRLKRGYSNGILVFFTDILVKGQRLRE